MKLFFVNGVKAGEELELALSEITVGRELDNIVNLPVEGVSRYHGRFYRTDDGTWMVEDSGSTNGIKCNRVRIREPRVLKEGDLVEFGDQMIRVTELASAVRPPVVLSLVDEDPEPESSPAEPVPAAVPVPPEPVRPPAVPPPEDRTGVSCAELADALKNGKLRLFGGRGTEKPAPEKAGAESGTPVRKSRFSNRLYYTLVICLALIGISVFYNSSKARPVLTAPAEVPDKVYAGRFMLYYEKLIITDDNVFYFVLHIENGKAKFQIDDLKSSRSFVRDGIVFQADAYEHFHTVLTREKFFSVASPPAAVAAGSLRDRRRMVVCDRGVLHEVLVQNNTRPQAFEEMEQAVNLFAENYALRTVSMTPEELQEQALLHYDKAEELFQNREARPANLREAIQRFKLAMDYLEAFVPKPTLYGRARKRWGEAERIRKDRIAALQSERIRLAKLREFAAISPILDEIMALSDPDSVDFSAARTWRIEIDSFLRKQGGRNR